MKMSKSLGNTISPLDLMKEHGADILRLWALSVDFTEDHRIGKEILGGVADQYRKLRNTFRYLLGALADFPRVLAQAAELREPHRVARFAEELAGLYHRWYDACRVAPQGDEPVGALNRTRLWLNDATGQVLRTALTTVGVSAPERM